MEKQILTTRDYSKFKRLNGNRVITPLRIKRIISSMVNVGYVTNPIIVNEKYEIIDGQGRFEALKALNLPVDYIVQNGIGIDECQAMNIHNSNWKDIDYIRSYAEIGNENYKKLLYCVEHNEYGLLIASTALKNLQRVPHAIIQSGSFSASDSEFEEAKKKLEYVDRFNEMIEKTYIDGHKTYLRQAILFCYTMKGLDKEKLFEKMNANIQQLNAFGNMESCMNAVEIIYNKNARDYFYVTTEYRKIMRENSTAHAKKRYQKRKQEAVRDDKNGTN